MTTKTHRLFLIGYAPPGWDMDSPETRSLVERLIDGCDECITMPQRLLVGWTFTPTTSVIQGSGPAVLDLGVAYRVVDDEHDGKIVLVERAQAPS